VDSGEYEYYTRIEENTAEFKVFGNSTSARIYYEDSSIRNLDWNHFFLTYDGNEIFLYLNRQLVASNQFTELIRDMGNYPLLIDFDGEIDELKIYNKFLNISEISLCPEGAQKNCPNQIGVCAGSKEVCINEVWSGCNLENYQLNNPLFEEKELSCNDGLDNDCDGNSDLFDLNCQCTSYDLDNDFWAIEEWCNDYEIIDCDDNNANIYPGALEICNDGLDNDCDGYIDCKDNDCILSCQTLEDDLVVLRNPEDNYGVKLFWKSKEDIDGYIVLRSDKLGWKGSINLIQDINVGDSILYVESTKGLFPGDEVHIRTEQIDFYVDEIINDTAFSVTHPMQENRNKDSYPISISAGWIKDYSDYTEIVRTENLNYDDTGLEFDKDYFYVIGYLKDSEIVSYSNPVNINKDEINLFYDAALGSNGGYAWKVGQEYNDLPQLIDGDDETEVVRIQYNDANIRNQLRDSGYYENFNAGFHKFNFNDITDIKKIEFLQNMDENHIYATNIQIKFDDFSELNLDLENDGKISSKDFGEYRLYEIPINKKSSYVNVYVNGVTHLSNSYPAWNKFSVYTDKFIEHPITSAVLVDTANIEIDFNQEVGETPTGLGTDELYDDRNGYETGYMLTSWPYTKKLFDSYRIQISDFWTKTYGSDLIQIGKLSDEVDLDELEFPLKEISSEEEIFALAMMGARIRIGDELTKIDGIIGDTLTVSRRGLENTKVEIHSEGTPVYAYKDVGQILRMQEVLPEFKVVKYPYAYVSGITQISNQPDSSNPDYIDLNDPIRTANLSLIVNKGEYSIGDVIRNSREKFLVLEVDDVNPNAIILTVQRGYDGTNQRDAQHSTPAPDIYKVLDYEPAYEGFKNDPTDYDNYFFDNLKTELDKCIIEGNAVPWLLTYGPLYMTKHRGIVDSIETTSAPTYTPNNVLVDSYNREYDDGDWWYYLAEGNDIENDLENRGDLYEFIYGELHILTGDAAGKVFFVRSHTGDSLRIVRTREDTYWEEQNPDYVNLVEEGVKPGDAYMIEHDVRQGAGVSPKYWQYHADFMYNLVKYIKENYAEKLAGRAFYIEHYNEPNLRTYGTWTMDSYIGSFNVLAETIRTGGPNFESGFGQEDVLLGAGSIAGGLNPANPITPTRGSYDFALSLIDESPFLDFISHHRYYVGSRTQKRDNSWEYYMLKSYAQSKGKDLMIFDSENSVATAGGTGKEEARHWAEFSVPYWESNFINTYYGDQGELGRIDKIYHFRLYHSDSNLFGMAIANESNQEALLDLVYWPLIMYQNHTSKNSFAPDKLVKVIVEGDQYGWVETMGTINGETGIKKVHLVNKKGEPITINLKLNGVGETSNAYMDSVIGGGDKQTIEDGYHSINYQGKNGNGTILRTQINNFESIVLEPYSANIISLE
jgi:hypothetical protein